MAEILLNPKSRQANQAPAYFRERALTEGKKLLKIVWDQAGGYPEHAWGYVQWSIRPYEQGYGCDGTTGLNIHLIAWRLCEALELDYPALYEQAYAWQGELDNQSWLRQWTVDDWKRIESETVLPALSEQALRLLLYDLNEINNASLVMVLEEEFTKLGYQVAEWWKP